MIPRSLWSIPKRKMVVARALRVVRGKWPNLGLKEQEEKRRISSGTVSAKGWMTMRWVESAKLLLFPNPSDSTRSQSGTIPSLLVYLLHHLHLAFSLVPQHCHSSVPNSNITHRCGRASSSNCHPYGQRVWELAQAWWLRPTRHNTTACG